MRPRTPIALLPSLTQSALSSRAAARAFCQSGLPFRRKRGFLRDIYWQTSMRRYVVYKEGSADSFQGRAGESACILLGRDSTGA